MRTIMCLVCSTPCVYTYIHTYAHMYVCMWKNINIWIYKYDTYILKYVCSSTHIYIHILMCTFHIYISMYLYSFTYIHTYVHIHTCVHIYIYKNICLRISIFYTCISTPSILFVSTLGLNYTAHAHFVFLIFSGIIPLFVDDAFWLIYFYFYCLNHIVSIVFFLHINC